MVQVSKKVITTGLVGALGVVATTQVPDVQAAVRGAVNLAPDSEHVTQFQSVTNFIQEVASGQKHGKVTTKSDVLREKGSKKSAIATFTDTTKHADKRKTTDVDNVASEAMTEALVTSSQADETTSSYYDDSTTDTTETDASTTPAEDAVVSEANSDSTQSDATSVYTIKDGDTLAKVAAATGISIADLQVANPDTDTSMLQIGQSISVPTAGTDDVSQTANYDTQYDATDATADTATYGADTTVVDDAQAQSAYTEDTELVQQSARDFTANTTSATLQSDMQADVQSLESAPIENQQNHETTTSDSQVMSNGDVVLDALPAKQSSTDTVTKDASSSNVQTLSARNAETGTLTQTQRNDIVSASLKYASQDIPYVWGGKTAAGLDCSGLVAKAYRTAGVSIPAYTVAEEAYVATQDVQSESDILSEAQPGDLLFWGGHGATWQVAIYVGDGQYVIASEPGQQVQVANIADTDVLPDFVGAYSFH